MAGHVRFILDNKESAEEFVREYATDAAQRADKIERCDGITYALNEPPNPEGGAVTLGVMGDLDAFVDHERGRWRSFRESGLVEDWETGETDKEVREARFGEEGSELSKRIFPLGAKMATLVYEEFDKEEGLPEILEEYPEEDAIHPIGLGMLSHHMMFANLGYSASEELDLYLFSIEEDLRIYAERNDEVAVDEKIDELIEELDEMRDEVKEGRPQP